MFAPVIGSGVEATKAVDEKVNACGTGWRLPLDGLRSMSGSHDCATIMQPPDYESEQRVRGQRRQRRAPIGGRRRAENDIALNCNHQSAKRERPQGPPQVSASTDSDDAEKQL